MKLLQRKTPQERIQASLATMFERDLQMVCPQLIIKGVTYEVNDNMIHINVASRSR